MTQMRKCTLLTGMKSKDRSKSVIWAWDHSHHSTKPCWVNGFGNFEMNATVYGDLSLWANGSSTGTFKGSEMGNMVSVYGKPFGSWITPSWRTLSGELATVSKCIFGLTTGLAQTLSARFHLIHDISQDKKMLVKDATEPNLPGHWNIMVTRNLHDWEIEEYERLLQTLNSIHLTEQEDTLWWNSSKIGKFTIRSFYNFLEGIYTSGPAHFPLTSFGGWVHPLELLSSPGKQQKAASSPWIT